MSTEGLADWLLACIAKDERRAKACALVYPPPWELADRGWMARVSSDEPYFREVVRLEQEHAPPTDGGWLGDYLGHIAGWDPARVLAECAAKRQIVELHAITETRVAVAPFDPWTGQPATDYWEITCNVCGPCGDLQPGGGCTTLKLLAQPFSSHPDYREDWRP